MIHDGLILDGRNRYRACEAAAVPVRLVPYDGADPLAYVVSVNLRRRHMSEDQRALVAAKIANMPQGYRADIEPSANWPKVSQAPAMVSVATAAKMMNVSTRSVTRAKAVVKHGVPELADKLAAGKIAVSTAADIAMLPPVEQRSILSTGDKKLLLRGAKNVRAAKAKVRRAVREVET